MGLERGVTECHELFQTEWLRREGEMMFEQNSEQKYPAMQRIEDRYPRSGDQ